MRRKIFGKIIISDKLKKVLEIHSYNKIGIIIKHFHLYNFGLKQIGKIPDYGFRMKMAKLWRNQMIKEFEEKEFVRREIKYKKSRGGHPFIRIICANLMSKRYVEYKEEWKERNDK